MPLNYDGMSRDLKAMFPGRPGDDGYIDPEKVVELIDQIFPGAGIAVRDRWCTILLGARMSPEKVFEIVIEKPSDHQPGWNCFPHKGFELGGVRRFTTLDDLRERLVEYRLAIVVQATLVLEQCGEKVR